MSKFEDKLLEMQEINANMGNNPNQLNVDTDTAQRKPRGSVLYQQMQKSKNTEMEDGRETKFYFERFRCLELGRFMLMLIAQGMNILSYDLEFEQRDQFANDLISYVIFVSTIILMIMTFASHKAKLEFEIASKQEPKEATILNTGKYKSLIFSMLLYIMFPYPWTSGIKIEFDFLDESSKTSRVVYYYFNEILTLIMLIRIIIMIQSVLVFSRFSGARPSRVCNFYACKSDALFIVKCMMKKYPMTVFSLLYFFSTMFFAFAIRICERPLVRREDDHWQAQMKENGEIYFDQNFNSYSVAIWCVFISLPTVGYGDRYPRTTLGRILLTITAILGAFLVSLLVNALTNSLELTSQEGKPFTVLRKLAAKLRLNEAASIIVVKIGKIKYKLQKNMQVTQKESKELQTALKVYKESETTYRNIQRETGIYEQLENEFEFISKQLEQFKQQNQVLKDSQELILAYCEQNKSKTNNNKKKKKQDNESVFSKSGDEWEEEEQKASDGAIEAKTMQYEFSSQENSLFAKNFY